MKQIWLLTAILVFTAIPLFAADVETIDKDELKNLLGSPNLVILDARTGTDWDSSDFKIKGAVRVNPSNVSSWAGSYSKDQTYVLYCA